ncbi:unnamed protein product [Microthlaspi erraticum]|uniref:Pentacotripeptide-repeat region of PRORP domain-containing protein n=1 Tax=Microthlaspi erraticum TaxID=1685480 RepID=A0A6D2IR30_9BRAS|nr:unnamed protein product [Microthlaspi erraticum]
MWKVMVIPSTEKRFLQRNRLEKGNLYGFYCRNRGFSGGTYDNRERLRNGLVQDLKLDDAITSTSKGVKPDVVTYNKVISGLCWKGLKEEALRKIKEDGPLPNSVTYNTLIRARLRDGDKAESAELINEMKRCGFAGHASTFGMVTHMLHDGRLDKSCKALRFQTRDYDANTCCLVNSRIVLKVREA